MWKEEAVLQLTMVSGRAAEEKTGHTRCSRRESKLVLLEYRQQYYHLSQLAQGNSGFYTCIIELLVIRHQNAEVKPNIKTPYLSEFFWFERNVSSCLVKTKASLPLLIPIE
jgi:hypothetical protein